MLQTGKFERFAFGLFAATLVLLAATFAMARPTLLMPDGEEYQEASTPFRMNMTCLKAVGSEAAEIATEPIKTTFIVEMTPSHLFTSGFVMNDEIGKCFANAPSSTFNAIRGQVDMHVFEAGGNTCKPKEGEVSFAIPHDNQFGMGRYATLTVKGVNYNCRL